MTDIDYNLRPAKHVERMMLAHTFRRLSPFGAVDSYRYVGFGAAYYRDFQLFHRDLGITSMISIEQDVANRSRYEFNSPFSCVATLFGPSNEILPTLPWDERTILWLDYTDSLKRNMLADVAFFVSNCAPGSVVVVTVNVHGMKLDDASLTQFREQVGDDNVPAGLDITSLTGWNLSALTRRIIKNKLLETLVARNGVKSAGARLQFHQLFNFEYADGAKMLTFGGLICETGQESLASSCNFDSLAFIRRGDVACRLELPKLTYKEINHLQAQLPGDGTPLVANGIPIAEIDRFRDVYRYFPIFASTSL